uniref:Uncharacterized protein n=1 Tax=Avena sativa TaxID=4498 RepID=A0ACD5Y6B7_AVESA
MSSGMSKSPKKRGKNAVGQEKVSSSARDVNAVLDFNIIRRPWSNRDAMKDMDTAKTLVLLQEPRGKDTSSDDEPRVDYSGSESAADNPDEVLAACSDKRTSAAECSSHPVVDIEERLSRSDAFDFSDVVQKDNQKLGESLEFGDVMAVINLMNFKAERNSASVDLYGGTEKCANEALLVEEPELTRNDDGKGLVDCPGNSAVRELERPKLDIEVSGKSENADSDDARGGISDASGKQTSLTEPIAREADQEPEQKLNALEEQAAKGATSVDEPGTDIPVEESGADNSDEVLTSCSGKSSSSVESDRGDEITSDMEEEAARGLLELSGDEAPVVEEVDQSCKQIRQALAEKSTAIELKEPKLDHEVLDNSVVMQEEEQKVDLSAPAPSDSSEEERSDMIDGQENQTA